TTPVSVPDTSGSAGIANLYIGLGRHHPVFASSPQTGPASFVRHFALLDCVGIASLPTDSIQRFPVAGYLYIRRDRYRPCFLFAKEISAYCRQPCVGGNPDLLTCV